MLKAAFAEALAIGVPIKNFTILFSYFPPHNYFKRQIVSLCNAKTPDTHIDQKGFYNSQYLCGGIIFTRLLCTMDIYKTAVVCWPFNFIGILFFNCAAAVSCFLALCKIKMESAVFCYSNCRMETYH